MKRLGLLYCTLLYVHLSPFRAARLERDEARGEGREGGREGRRRIERGGHISLASHQTSTHIKCLLNCFLTCTSPTAFSLQVAKLVELNCQVEADTVGGGSLGVCV